MRGGEKEKRKWVNNYTKKKKNEFPAVPTFGFFFLVALLSLPYYFQEYQTK